MIAQFKDIPKYFLPGGQLWGDSRVMEHWDALRKAKAFADHLGLPLSEEDMVSVLMGITDGVAYTTETDQERKDNPNYAPIESSGEFWVLYQAQKAADSFEDRNREWPDWADYQDFDDVLFTDLNDDPEDEEELSEFIPGTSPWQEYVDNQRSRMVNDMTRAAAKGKKWAKHPAFQLVALQALDDGASFERARELAFMVYHASFKGNVVKGHNNGLIVSCADFKTGKRTNKWKNLPWKYVDLCADYLHPEALLEIARKRWQWDKDTALILVVSAFCNSLV